MIPALFALVVSCAKKEREDISGREQAVFDAWMEKYHPEAEKLPSGMYIDWLVRNPSGRKAENGNWLMTNFTRSFMDGTVFASNDPDIAEQLDYFTYKTHFYPKYFGYYPEYYTAKDYALLQNLAVGEVELLSMMREGERAKIYMPKNLGYPYSYGYEIGFSTGMVVDAFTSLQMDIELAKVVSDPVEYEKEQVEEYAENNLGISNPENNYTVPGLYMKVTQPYGEGNTITEDTRVSVYYVGRFLDGFVFDTNIDTVAVNNNIYGVSGYSAIEFLPNDESDLVAGFTETVRHMKKGEWARTVFVSALGYGAEGQLAQSLSETSIPPYTPLVFDIYVELK